MVYMTMSPCVSQEVYHSIYIYIHNYFKKKYTEINVLMYIKTDDKMQN